MTSVEIPIFNRFVRAVTIVAERPASSCLVKLQQRKTAMRKLRVSILECLFVASHFLVMSGCQKDSGVSGLEPMPQSVMVPCEGPGFKLEIPENWKSSTSGNRIVVKPSESEDEAEISLVLEPYAAGETPQTVIADLIESRFHLKGGIKPSEIEVSGFPTFRQFYRSDASGRSPDRILYVLATPGGKVTVHASLRDGNDMSKYMGDFLGVVYSVRL